MPAKVRQRTDGGTRTRQHGAMRNRSVTRPTDIEDAAGNDGAMALALLSACQALGRAHAALRASLAREQALRQQVGVDTLTGLPNRMAFGRRSSRTLAAHSRDRLGFGVLFIDLDGFKSVNDRLGHAAGDALLGVIGARLVHALRTDDFVSRHGGDEFVCLLPGVDDLALAEALARKLVDAISAPCRLGDRVEQVGASVGVALYPRDGLDVTVLLDRADQAMLWAKARNAGIGVARQLPQAMAAVAADTWPLQPAPRAPHGPGTHPLSAAAGGRTRA